jgi:hypothetical protein
MVELRIRSAQCPSAKNVIQTAFVRWSPLAREVILLPTSQNIASSTPKAPNNDRADYRNGCRYSPIGMSVVGSHYKNINRPQQCGYARCPINRISQASDHGSLHRVRLPRPCNPLLNCSRSRKCKQKGSCRMSSWLRQIRTTSRIVKLRLQFPGWELGLLDQPQSREPRARRRTRLGFNQGGPRR